MDTNLKDKYHKLQEETEEMKDTMTPDLTLMSYNVLLPTQSRFIRAITKPEIRYEYHFNTLFPSLSPDILCLQECSELYINMLEKSQFFKDGYSHSGAFKSDRSGHHPLIVSRLPMEVLYQDCI